MLDKNNNTGVMNQDGSTPTELELHTAFFNGEYYNFELSQEDTLRFSDALDLLDDFKGMISLVVDTNSNFFNPDYLDEKIELVYNYLSEEKDYERILLNPRKAIVDAIERGPNYYFECDVKGSENNILLGEMIGAFSNVIFSYLSEHKEYSKHVQWIFLG